MRQEAIHQTQDLRRRSGEHTVEARRKARLRRRVSSARPRRTAVTIWRAARPASIDTKGRLAARLNSAASRPASPLNCAFMWEPVRISQRDGGDLNIALS